MGIKLKMRTLTPNAVAEIVGGRVELYGGATAEDEILSVASDSSEAEPGTLFFAIKGSHVDGADFISEAVERGAVCALTSHVPPRAAESGKSFAAVIVDDVIRAVGKLAGWYRDLSEAKFIAVTGSVGKTTTKEFIAAVSSIKFQTHKTEGNHNNELGLPLSLFELMPEHKVSVVEMGMSAPGEIEYLSRMVKPDIAVITNIGTSHLATLGSRENICEAKLEICRGMRENGVLLINGDEPLLLERAGYVYGNVKLMSIRNRNGDYRALNIRTGSDTITFDMIYDNKAVTNIEIPVIGNHNVYNALTAYSVGTMLGISDELIRHGLMSFKGSEMRQHIYNVGGLTIIDDCYNASPESMRAAIDVLVALASKRNLRPMALLGDMLELGDYTRLLHDQLGQYAAQMKIAKLFCYGMQSDVVAEAAIKKGIRVENVFVCLDTHAPQAMADMILDVAGDGDILLVKASRAVHAEAVIECIKRGIHGKR